jgi:P4 family phage/plasmid primase-like protien
MDEQDVRSAIRYWAHFAKFGLVKIDSANRLFNLETKEQRSQDVDSVDYNARIKDGWYDNGLAIRLGKTIGGEHYGVAADLDGMDAVLAWFGSWDNVLSYAKKNRIEWHKDQNRIHLIFYTDKPLENRIIKITPESQIEIKCEGSLLRVSPSVHEDGNRFTSIDSEQIPIMRSYELESKIDYISRGYMSDNDKEEYEKWLDKPDTIIGVGGGRHNAILHKINSYFWKWGNDWLDLTDDQRFERAWEWAERHCKPNYSREEFDRLCYDVTKKYRQERDALHELKRANQQTNQGKSDEKETTGLIEQASESIMRRHRILTIEESKEILYYSEGVYIGGGDILIEKEAESMFGYLLSTKAVAEIKGHIMRQTYHKRSDFDSDINVINLQNGLYNCLTGEFKQHTPDYLSINQKPIPYNSKAKACRFGKYLKEVLYPSEIRTAVEVMAYTFYRDNPFELINILFGYGANGKSVFTGLLACLHGMKNVSNVPLSAIVKNPFALSDLENKDVNIDAELSSATIRDTAILKKLTGRQPVRLERKNQRAYDSTLHAKLFFSANKIPETADDSDAYFRRNVVISFPNKFEGETADPDLLSKLATEEELSGIFNVLMTALRRVLKRGRVFVNEKTIQQRREKYELATNPVMWFIKDAITEDSVESDKTTKDQLFHAYRRFCKQNTLAVESKENFGKILKSKHGFQEGRESSGERRTVWKGVRLAEKYQIEAHQQTLTA